MRSVSGLAAMGLLLCAAPALAETPPASLSELDARLTASFKDAKIPGAEVAIVEHGNVVFVKAYGLADKENKIQAAPDSVFRAGSISKSITSIAVMILVEQKKLSLDGKLYAGLISLAMLALCAYMPPIGWIGMRTWTM